MLLKFRMPEVIQKTNCTNCLFKSLVFNKLNDSELDFLDQFKIEKIYQKGEIVVNEGDTINDFLYIKTGLVKLFKTGLDGKDHILSVAKPQDFIGFLSMFSNTNYQYSIATIENSTLCFINVPALKKLIENNGVFALDILDKMSLAVDGILDTRISLCSRNLRGRIALLLLYFSDEVYHKDEYILPLARKEIAGLIEMTTENVIRILSEFRHDGLIEMDGSEISLLNKKLIEAISTAG